jgi:hypothetical protein
MTSVREAIEEMIEESYLVGLSEDEIRRDFTRFIDTCYHVIHANVKDRTVISSLVEDLAREKTCILIADRTRGSNAGVGVVTQAEGMAKSAHELFAEKVARRKRMILKTIGGYDPQLVRLIDRRRFQGDFQEADRPKVKIKKRRNWERYRFLLLRFGYATTVVVIILLIYLGFIQKP